MNKYDNEFDKKKAMFPIKRDQFPDPRNWPYKTSISFIQELPDIVDHSGFYPDIKNQGQLNSCQSFAAGDRWEYLSRNKGRFFDCSEMQIYYNTRKRENVTQFNTGAYIIDSVKAVVEDGVCLESYWPYGLNFTEKPNLLSYVCARVLQMFKISTTYYQVQNSPYQIMCALADGNTLIFGMSIFPGFMKVGKDGLVPMPGKTEKSLGGHAMKIYGYDNKKKLYKVKNSWGNLEGDHGWFYVPYDYMTNYGFDIYVIK